MKKYYITHDLYEHKTIWGVGKTEKASIKNALEQIKSYNKFESSKHPREKINPILVTVECDKNFYTSIKENGHGGEDEPWTIINGMPGFISELEFGVQEGKIKSITVEYC